MALATAFTLSLFVIPGQTWHVVQTTRARTADGGLEIELTTGNVSLTEVTVYAPSIVCLHGSMTWSPWRVKQDDVVLCRAVDLPDNETYYISECDLTNHSNS